VSRRLTAALLPPQGVSLQRLHLTRTGATPSTPPGLPVSTHLARLLKAILATGVEDNLLKRDPRRIKGAGQKNPPNDPC
jgi:hypothetical protein